MNIDEIIPDLDAELAALHEVEDESQNVLPLKSQIEQVETELKQYDMEWKSLRMKNDPTAVQRIAQLSNEIKRCSRKIKELKPKYNVSLERLWNGDIPDIEFISHCPLTTHTQQSNTDNYHATVDGLLSPLVPPHIDSEILPSQSIFIDNVFWTNWKYEYYAESKLVDGVKLLLHDILKSIKLRSLVQIEPEALFSGTHSNVWVLKNSSGIPFLPIVCKKPLTAYQKVKLLEKNVNINSILEDFNVLGQCFHYMMQLHHSFGQQVVYGIITTLEEWRILSLTPTISHQNSVFATNVYSFHNSKAIRSTLEGIANIINQTYHSTYVPVPLLSPDRSYIVFNENGICWGNIPSNMLKSHPDITLNIPNPDPQLQITILRCFQGGADGNVFLGLTQNFDLVVVKKFTNLNGDNPHAFDNELKYWSLVNEKEAVPLGNKNTTLVLPFAFHCLQDENGTPYFDFNLNKWGSVTENLIKDERLTSLSEKFQSFYEQNPITPENALKSAMTKFADKKCVHEDIEWRHVALLPVVSRDKKKHVIIQELIPILIDLSRVHNVSIAQEAKLKMSKVNQLIPSKQGASKVTKDKSDVSTTIRQTNLQTTTSSSSSCHIPQYCEMKLQHNSGDTSSNQIIIQNCLTQDEEMQDMNNILAHKILERFHDVSGDDIKEKEIFPQSSSRSTQRCRKEMEITIESNEDMLEEEEEQSRPTKIKKLDHKKIILNEK